MELRRPARLNGYDLSVVEIKRGWRGPSAVFKRRTIHEDRLERLPVLAKLNEEDALERDTLRSKAKPALAPEFGLLPDRLSDTRVMETGERTLAMNVFITPAICLTTWLRRMGSAMPFLILCTVILGLYGGWKGIWR